MQIYTGIYAVMLGAAPRPRYTRFEKPIHSELSYIQEREAGRMFGKMLAFERE
jgi:hypothetical protein